MIGAFRGKDHAALRYRTPLRLCVQVALLKHAQKTVLRAAQI